MTVVVGTRLYSNTLNTNLYAPTTDTQVNVYA